MRDKIRNEYTRETDQVGKTGEKLRVNDCYVQSKQEEYVGKDVQGTE